MTLRSGDTFNHWQVANVTETLFDVDDMPMQGEMDSLFFLTKDKNVIPHTYPCRTVYADEVAGKRPRPGAPPDWAQARNVLPFGAPLLDLSGFWFRATRISGWARTTLHAACDGTARVTLGTCGAALLFVNGQEAGWIAPATRNAMAEKDMDLPLLAGENEITVWFDDLAERDARVLLSLLWLDGPAAEATLPYMAPEPAVRAVERLLASAHFNQTRYDTAPVTLLFPDPLPGGVTADVQICVSGDFMSHDSITVTRPLSSGQGQLDLGPSSAFPADYRHFTMRVTSGGFTGQRTLATEISRAQAQGTAPAQQNDRISEALQTIAQGGEADMVTALAALATGDLEQAAQHITTALPPIEACWDCADFALVPLLWIRAQHHANLPRDLTARIDAAVLKYRYWMDEPGNDVQWYFSENHALLFHTAAYLAGDMFPEQRFARSGRLGREQSAVGRERVRAWLDHFERAEMAEFNSAPYFPIDLKGLTSLFAFAPDADIRTRAAKGIERLVTIIARSAHQGVITGAQGRSYEHTLCAGETLELSGLARLLWGRGSYGARVHCLPQMALCLRDHGLTLPDLTATACYTGNQAMEWCYWQGENAFARLYHHKTAHTAMGSAACYRWGDWGYQETLIHARLGHDPQAQIWINHPGELIQSGYGRPSYWGGSANVPRVQQYRDLAIVIFDGVAPQPNMTHCWFPTQSFDEWAVDGNRAMARAGNGMVTLRASGPLSLIHTGPSAQADLQLCGRDGIWVVRLGQGGDITEHQARHGLHLQKHANNAYAIADPDYGQVVFHADGRVTAEGRILDPSVWTRAGTSTELPLSPIGRDKIGATAPHTQSAS